MSARDADRARAAEFRGIEAADVARIEEERRK